MIEKSYLDLVFPSAGGRLDPEGGATPEEIEAVKRELMDAEEEMTLCDLTDTERELATTPLSPEMKDLIMEYVAFLGEQEAIAREVEVGATEMAEAVKKDVALAEAEAAAADLVSVSGRGTAILLSAITGDVDAIEEAVARAEAAAEGGGPARPARPVGPFRAAREVRERTTEAAQGRRDRIAARRRRQARELDLARQRIDGKLAIEALAAATPARPGAEEGP